MSNVIRSRFRTFPSQRPPGDLRGGAHPNLVGNGTVTFLFFAPYKPFVALVGDFNQWDTRAHPMQTDGLGLWWVTIKNPGTTRYGFYVLIDDNSHAWVGDPYAAVVDWSDKAPWGLFAGNEQPYLWKSQEWKTPPLREMIIYELCVRDAAGRWQGNRARLGTFRQLEELVPYIASLGVNALELMPIQTFPGDSSWGYNPVFYFAPAPSYGSPADFKSLVDCCHAYGLAVIVDVAFNHAWGDHPWYHIYPPLYGPNGEQLADLSPFFHHTPQEINMWGGVDWDHFAPETTRYFQDIVRYWLREYRIDGFRFDWVGGVDYDSKEPFRSGFNPWHGIAAICWAARQEKPDCVLIGEYWSLAGTNPEKSAPRLVAETAMDAVWNGYFHHTLDDILNQRWEWEKRDIFRAIGGFHDLGYGSATEVINYSCSHDEVRPEHEIKFYSGKYIAIPKGWTLQQVALARALLGLVAVLTAPGVPMLYAGQEFGEDTPRTIDFLPTGWERRTQPGFREQLEIVTRLLRLRRNAPALRSDAIEFMPNDFAQEKIVRYRRWSGDDPAETVWVVLNLGSNGRYVEFPGIEDGAWIDVISGKRRSATGGRLRLLVGPHQAVVLTRRVQLSAR